MSNIRIGIAGYGNLGRGAELSILQNPDMELVGVFTRRSPDKIITVSPGTPVFSVEDAKDFTSKIDVMLLCGGSATDLMLQGPEFVKMFHTIDSFDTHAKIPEYFELMDKTARENGHACLISVGWDPGLFSLTRMYFENLLPDGRNYTFWGKGVSQGHSDAIRRIDGVLDAIQYTVPCEDALEKVRSGKMPAYSAQDQHKRECYVVAKPGASTKDIAEKIASMPNYFADYETSIHFISEDELKREHGTMPHGGAVLRTGRTGSGEASNQHVMELNLKLDSNPEFTSSILVAYARALHKLASEGIKGAKTVFDVPPGYLSFLSAGDQRKTML